MLLGKAEAETETAVFFTNARGAEAVLATPRADDAAVFDEACIASISRERGVWRQGERACEVNSSEKGDRRRRESKEEETVEIETTLATARRRRHRFSESIVEAVGVCRSVFFFFESFSALFTRPWLGSTRTRPGGGASSTTPGRARGKRWREREREKERNRFRERRRAIVASTSTFGASTS